MALSPLPWHLLYLLHFSLFLQSSTITCQTHRISIGSSLTASNKNVPCESPSGEFALGFQQFKKDGFLLAIWFNKVPEKTIVWSANGNGLAQKGSKLELNKDGKLILTDPKGNQIWSTDTFGAGVTYGEILNTGNLVLYNQDSVISWESFNEPTDTLLPTQILSKGKRLVARYSENNYSNGRFLFILESNGNLVLYTRNFPLDATNHAYWDTKTEGSGFQVMFNQSGSIYLQAKNGTILNMLSSIGSSMEDFYQRAILENDGVFRHYVYPKGEDPSSRGWPKSWTESSTSIPSNICASIKEDTGGGACGFNSYCRIGVNQRRTCDCPNGYTFIDPSDPVKGCKQSFEAQSCDEGEDDGLFDFYSMEHTDWPFNDYQHFEKVGEDWCRKACLRDCLCAVAIVRDGDCWKKRVPLSNGMMDPSTVFPKALIKVRKNDSSPDSNKNDHSVLVLFGSVLLSGSVFINFLLILAAFLAAFYFNPKSKAIQPNPVESGMNLQVFTYEELNKATNEFNEQLGSGASATVFKGVLPFEDGNLIAVKKFHNLVSEGEKVFKAEVSAIGRTNHKNLVQLIGLCTEEQHRFLVYEFMSNGSLACFIFGPSWTNWDKRMRIAQGTARGLFYLHEECSTQIIHCDVKPQNILLDDFFTARISDFGLAKLLKTDQTRTTTGIRGTKGYVAPEWFRNLPVTAKVDVYSFGIVLLELICCRKNFEAEAEENQMILSDWAYDCFHDRNLELLVKNDEEALDDIKRVEKYVMVAIWCIQEDPSLRPTMKKVTQMLEETIEVPVPPDLASFASSL